MGVKITIFCIVVNTTILFIRLKTTIFVLRVKTILRGDDLTIVVWVGIWNGYLFLFWDVIFDVIFVIQ